MEKPRGPIKAELETGWKPRLPICVQGAVLLPQKTWDGPEISGVSSLPKSGSDISVRGWTQI